MKPTRLYFLACVGVLLLLTACEGNCKDEQIERVKWVKISENISKDTLVAYSILENKTQYDPYSKQVIHSIKIRNDNSLYANKFSISVEYNFVNSNQENEDKIHNSNFVSILPDSSYTFTFGRQAEKTTNFNSNITVKQKPLTITDMRRIDVLKKDTITVNSCNENVDALKEKYKTIKELFNSNANTRSER